MDSEKKLEKKLKERVEKLKGLCIKLWCLSFTGLPDRIVLLAFGRIWFVELKSEGQKPKKRQPFVIRQLTRLGFKVRLIDTEILLQEFFKEIEQ